MTKVQKAEQDEARDLLRAEVLPGDVLHTVVRSVARSGMSRTLDVYSVRDGELRNLSRLVGLALDYRRNDSGALKVSGCGMDMGFAVVYEVGAVLFADGFACVGEAKRCPSNDHNNGDRSYRPHLTPSGRVSRARDCQRCEGTGHVERGYLGGPGTTREDCRACVGTGRVGPGHWHTSGGYALRQEWI